MLLAFQIIALGPALFALFQSHRLRFMGGTLAALVRCALIFVTVRVEPGEVVRSGGVFVDSTVRMTFVSVAGPALTLAVLVWVMSRRNDTPIDEKLARARAIVWIPLMMVDGIFAAILLVLHFTSNPL